MKVGDIVQVVNKCSQPGDRWHPMGSTCACFFCCGNSNRIGVVLGPAPRNQMFVMFDCGEWRLDAFDVARGDVEVINGNR